MRFIRPWIHKEEIGKEKKKGKFKKLNYFNLGETRLPSISLFYFFGYIFGYILSGILFEMIKGHFV